MVEGARLESEYTAKPYRGFESLPLRHCPVEPSSRAAMPPAEAARYSRQRLSLPAARLGHDVEILPVQLTQTLRDGNLIAVTS